MLRVGCFANTTCVCERNKGWLKSKSKHFRFFRPLHDELFVFLRRQQGCDIPIDSND